VQGKLLEKDPGEIRGMFGRIAHRYDLLNHLLSLGRDVAWRKRMARRIAEVGACPVLDVCAGTGDVALALPASAAPAGTDFSLPMLAAAARKARRRGRTLPLFAADALALPLQDGCAGGVTVAFGVRNFHSLDRGLAELVRVLRPGGVLLVLEFSHPSGPLGALASLWSRTVPPIVGRIVSGDREAYQYLPASVDRFPDTRAMCARLEAMGLERVRAERLTGGVATLYEGWRPDRIVRDAGEAA